MENEEARVEMRELGERQREEEREKRRERYRERSAVSGLGKGVIISQEKRFGKRQAILYAKSQEIIDETILRRLNSIKFTHKPVYNGRIKNNGRVLVTLDGMRKTSHCIEIWKNKKVHRRIFW